jgi:hypothetical protein
VKKAEPARKEAAQARTRNLTPARATLERIALPAPTLFGGNVAAALKKRRSVRSFSGKKLSRQMLSSLLWSACGAATFTCLQPHKVSVPGFTTATGQSSLCGWDEARISECFLARPSFMPKGAERRFLRWRLCEEEQ